MCGKATRRALLLCTVLCTAASSLSDPADHERQEQQDGQEEFGEQVTCVPDIHMPLSCEGRRSRLVSEYRSAFSVEEYVSYILYTEGNGENPTDLIVGHDLAFNQSNYNTTAKTKIIIHGYFSSGKNFDHITYAYLAASNHNVIVMDWSALAKWCYCEHVLHRLEAVGQHLGRLLDFLADKGVRLPDVHIVGHSLGAHIAGVASDGCRAGRVGRITALDPARPGFALKKQKDRLQMSYADFVDVIHTCSDAMGIMEPMGHVDFYPNAGISPQPGCAGVGHEVCSHSRAHYLFAESITTDVGFRAVKCSTWDQYEAGMCDERFSENMGERIDVTRAEGLYFLKTGASCPYHVLGGTTRLVATSFAILVSVALYLSCAP